MSVAIIMGSDSDLAVMKEAFSVLDELGIPSHMTVVSAHRTPQRLFDFANTAEENGIKVIIAGAGGAAHLPGMVAAIYPLPVIGVPISATKLNGEDALHSIVQMPGGVPVATVAIDGARNAGILAAQILGTSSPDILVRLKQLKQSMVKQCIKKALAVESNNTRG